MSLNKLALIRYRTIDNCLQNRFRKWTLDDLVEACAEAIYEYEGITAGVSKRTVQLDIQNMRSEKLGYVAPIVVVDKKFYTYGEKNYSITNTPLTKQDIGTLSEVVQLLKQFKGFSYFGELNEMVKRLEDKIQKQQHKGKSNISFETNPLLKGIDLIDPLHRAINNQQTLEINYQSFKAREAANFIFFPYHLKEYRNRWFLVGARKKDAANAILTLALDRIADFKILVTEPFVKNRQVNFDTFYNDVIGVSKNLNQEAVEIVFKIDRENAPYLLTKPLHATQRLLSQEKEYSLFTIKVVWNFELERELLGFGEQIQVISPGGLRRRLAKRLQEALQAYQTS